MRYFLSVILFCLLIVPSFSWSEPVDSPEIKRQGSFKFMQNAAVKGHSRAAYYLGAYYYHGVGTAVDKGLALFWIKKAAEAGITEAELAYGLLLLAGDGITADRASAIEWIGKAARKDNAKAREVMNELLSYRGSGRSYLSDTEMQLPDILHKNDIQESFRLEGKGLLLDRGTFGLEFTLPPLYDPLTPQTQQKPALNQMLERLQGGTIDIIFRPAQK